MIWDFAAICMWNWSLVDPEPGFARPYLIPSDIEREFLYEHIISPELRDRSRVRRNPRRLTLKRRGHIDRYWQLCGSILVIIYDSQPTLGNLYHPPLQPYHPAPFTLAQPCHIHPGPTLAQPCHIHPGPTLAQPCHIHPSPTLSISLPNPAQPCPPYHPSFQTLP